MTVVCLRMEPAFSLDAVAIVPIPCYEAPEVIVQHSTRRVRALVTGDGVAYIVVKRIKVRRDACWPFALRCWHCCADGTATGTVCVDCDHGCCVSHGERNCASGRLRRAHGRCVRKSCAVAVAACNADAWRSLWSRAEYFAVKTLSKECIRRSVDTGGRPVLENPMRGVRAALEIVLPQHRRDMTRARWCRYARVVVSATSRRHDAALRAGRRAKPLPSHAVLPTYVPAWCLGFGVTLPPSPPPLAFPPTHPPPTRLTHALHAACASDGSERSVELLDVVQAGQLTLEHARSLSVRIASGARSLLLCASV